MITVVHHIYPPSPTSDGDFFHPLLTPRKMVPGWIILTTAMFHLAALGRPTGTQPSPDPLYTKLKRSEGAFLSLVDDPPTRLTILEMCTHEVAFPKADVPEPREDETTRLQNKISTNCAEALEQLRGWISVTCDQALLPLKKKIMDTRKSVLKERDYKIKYDGYCYSIKMGYLMVYLRDLRRGLTSWMINHGENDYPTAFRYFLEAKNGLLVEETPESFLSSFGTFFDKYLKERMKLEFKDMRRRRVEKSKLWAMRKAGEMVMNELSASSEIRKLYAPKPETESAEAVEEKPTWEDCFERVQNLLSEAGRDFFVRALE